MSHRACESHLPITTSLSFERKLREDPTGMRRMYRLRCRPHEKWFRVRSDRYGGNLVSPRVDQKIRKLESQPFTGIPVSDWLPTSLRSPDSLVQ